MMMKYIVTLGTPSMNEDVIATIQAMRKQERTYKTTKYLLPLDSSHDFNPVDIECRSKMVEWCFQIGKHCEFHAETSSIAMSLVDRYVATQRGKHALSDRSLFKLVVMTCFYTAIKIHEPEALTPSIMKKLSRNEFRAKDFEQCESDILKALQWKVNPPTPYSFARSYAACIPTTLLDGDERRGVMDNVYVQLEQATKDFSFLGTTSSAIAFAALSNSLAGYFLKDSIMSVLGEVANIDTKDCTAAESNFEKHQKRKSFGRGALMVSRFLSSSKHNHQSSSGKKKMLSKRSSKEENRSPRCVTSQ